MGLDMEHVSCSVIPYGSKEYDATIELRYRILREPLGIGYAEWDRSQDVHDTHVAARLNDAIVGCLVLTDPGSGILKMRAVAVDEAMQGKGIGRAMVEFSEIFARENGFETIKLSARVTAIPFYLNLGYEVISEEYEEVTIPHRMMAKAMR